ncbi:MAG TPA: M3 family oligoendopeptidase [Alphaproteobacteria bacterium]|nr:M3 family oligoendopeptidase [Alphaproteobacteria bacterium]
MQDKPDNKPDTPPPQDMLPRWDLSALFPGKDSPEFKNALAAIDRDVEAFARDWRGKVAKADGAGLGAAVARFEKITENIARVETYVSLLRAADNREDAFASKIDDRLRGATQELLFFTLELNKIPEPALLQKIAAPELSAYAPWIGALRASRPHQLDDEAEKYRHLKEGAAEDAWRRLFDLTMQGMRFDVDGQKLTEAETLNIIDNDRDAAKRRAAWESFTKGLGENIGAFALITNTLAALKAAEDTQRGFEKPEDSRHLENHIERDTVAAMSVAVKAAQGKTSHRYYAWKAKKSGVARLHPADRNALLGDAPQKHIPWDEAKEIVLSAFACLSPEMEKIGRRFFDEGWIDAAPRAGKDSGAFSHPSVPSAHPFILLNYFGTPGDVMTLAHELGHGIHQVLAAKQGHLMADTPLTVAETASVFGEMLTFRALLAREEDPAARRAMLAGKIEDMLNTSVRQTAFFTFEQKLHAEYREKGELSPERIGALWRDVTRDSLGPAINMDTPGAENLWAYVPHFIHTPFYVYAYAFGDCLVNALYDSYDKAADKQDFAQKYTALLSAGGSKTHEELLSPFGFDIDNPAFWRKGLGVIERYIDELFALDQKIERAQKAEQDFKKAGKSLTSDKDGANDNAPDKTAEKAFKKASRRKPPAAGLDETPVQPKPPKPPKAGGAP